MALLKDLLSNIAQLTRRKIIDPKAKSIGISEFRFNSQERPEDREAMFPGWNFSAIIGQPRRIDISLIRNLSQSAWVQMVTKTFKRQITTIPWKVVVADEDDNSDHKADIKKATDFYKRVNPEQNIETVHSEVITDISEIDAGVFNYVYSNDSYEFGQVPVYNSRGEVVKTERGLVLKPLGKRELVKIKSVDGGTILKQIDYHKNLLRYVQYTFKHPRQSPNFFDKEEISYLIMNPRPYSVYGFSSVQSVQQVLDVLIQGTRYNKDLYWNDAIPKVLVGLPGLDTKELNSLKRNWNRQYKNRVSSIAFVNWALDKVFPLNMNNRDLEWLDGQKWYFKIVFGIYGVSSTEAGFFENSNKSNDDGQERITVRNAMEPLLKKLADEQTNKGLVEILQKEDHGLEFKFFPKNHALSKVEFEQDMQELDHGTLTVNEFRKKKDRPPVEWGDVPYVATPVFNDPNSDDESDESNNQPSSSNDDKPSKSQSNPSSKSLPDELITPGKDVVEDAKDYSEFLLKTFNRFEKRSLAAVDSINKSQKTFGDFLKNLFNSVNTVAFAIQVRQFLKIDLVAGMESAEKETGTDIGFTQAYQEKLNVLADQQIEGYTINGKKWHGIKGVTKQIQHDVIVTVQNGLAEGKSTREIKEDIKGVYDGFSDWRANMIGRTETNRALSEAKLLGYKETGIEGGKIWLAAQPRGCKNCSPICDRLSKRYGNNPIPLDDLFIDPKTLKGYMNPPGHPNCKSVLGFRAK